MRILYNDKMILNTFITDELLEFISGHFPGNIIIPGAAIIEVVDKAFTEYFELKLNRKYKLKSIPQVLFYSVIHNFSEAALIFDINQQCEETLRVDCMLVVNNMKIVKLRMMYT